MIGRFCWLVGLFDTDCAFSKSTSLIFMRLGTDVEYLCQISLLTFETSRFEVKTAVLKIFNYNSSAMV